MSGGVPANTSTTTTVNQSPWQNQTYRTLALGTPGNLGPVAQQLKIGQQLTNEWQDIQSGRNPGLYYGMPNASPEQLAAAQATRDVGFAAGRAPATPETPAAPAKEEVQTAAQGGIMNLRGFASGGDTAPKDLTKKEAARLKHLNDRIGYGQTLSPKDKKQLEAYTNKQQTYQTYQAQQKADADKAIASRPYSYSDLATPTAFLDPKTGQNMLADAQLAYQKARELGTPEQIGQATSAYNAAIQGLQGLANYTPQQVEASKIARGDVRDVAAQQADVERYKATNIVPTARETGVTTAAPGSWTQAGTAAQYMSPYMQNVVDIQKREAQRDFGKQMAMLNAQAAGQGAYGGSRQAIERSEARRNQAQRLADIEAQGLQQSYSQGMGQFQQEQQLGSQVGMANTAQINQLKSQYMQMGLTEAQANQAAQNAASQFGAAAQNQAYNNYVQQMLTAQGMNQGMDYNTAQQNAQLKQQAALANQQAGLQANQQNIGAYGAMGNMAQGLGGLGATQSQIGLNNLAALGQSATAQTQYAQGALDRNTQNAMNWYNLPTTFNAAGINALNAQPVSGGSNASSTNYGQAKWFNKGGKVQWGPKK